MKKYFEDLQRYLNDSELTSWGKQLPSLIEKNIDIERHGDLADWLNTLKQLPAVTTSSADFFNQVSIGTSTDTTVEQKKRINALLRELIPWRKGPLTIHETVIDTEWHSDWKWDRVLPHIDSLKNKLVLDVGCGNGYHCWRMLGQGADRVIGIDPSPRFVVQFYATKHFAPKELRVDIIPTTLDDFEHLPPVFDTVFSMGVLYHRASPFDHLRQLKSLIRPGGQLVLETLIIEGEEGKALVPEGRYAMMNNVWFLPSADTMLNWLRKVGFQNPRFVDSNHTSLHEQRSTEWMPFHSLKEFLDPEDMSKTAEGHPAPQRGVFLAEVK